MYSKKYFKVEEGGQKGDHWQKFQEARVLTLKMESGEMKQEIQVA